jgi:hypothetical protein
MYRFSLLIAFLTFSGRMCPAAEPGQTIVMPVVPKFIVRGGWITLSVADDSRSFEFAVGEGTRLGSITLATNHTYEFTLRVDLMNEANFRDLPYDFTKKVALLRIEERGRLMWAHEICEVHKTNMVKKVVPIFYGFPHRDKDEPTLEEERRLFPHRHEFVGGGCVVRGEKTSERYVCDECKGAFEHWRKGPEAREVVSLPWSQIPWPKVTRYDNDLRLRLVYLTAFRDGYIAALNDQHGIAVFRPEAEDDKAKVLGYADGQLAGDTARTLSAQQAKGGQPNKKGAANGSQPIRSETNRTSSAAGSRR